MDLRASITAAMEAINRSSKVTLDEENQHRINDLSLLSKEERDFYKLMFGDDLAAVRHRRLHCTACDVHIGSAPAKSTNMFVHPTLYTLLCADCRKFYGDGNFEQGEDATDMFCRWCANGGNLYCCSYCSNTFCNKCIKRNFDPLVRKKIEDEEKWKCFVCDPADLYTARAVCWALLQHVQTVTRILKNDPYISKEDFKDKMNRDESKCCSRKRNKAKRRKLSTNDSDDEDETYKPSTEDNSPLSTRRIPTKRSPRLSSMTNGQQDKTMPKLKIETDSFNDDEEDDDDLLPPMIPCVQYMVEGDSSETLNATLNSQENSPDINPPTCISQPTLHINPIPTANLLKVALPRLQNQTKYNPLKRKRNRAGLQHILPAPTSKFVMVKNSTAQNNTQTNSQAVEYSSMPLRATNTPMVAIPSNKSPPPPPPPPSSSPSSSNQRVHTIEYSSLPLRAPSIPSSSSKQTVTQPARVQVQKGKTSSSVKEVGVIEIDSDSDEPELEEITSSNLGEKKKDPAGLRRGRQVLKNMLSQGILKEVGLPTFPDSCYRRGSDKWNNQVEEEIDLRTEEVRLLFKMIGTKLRKVPMLHLPNHNNLRSTRVKTRRFHVALSNAITALSTINDKVVHKYSSWRKTLVEESRQTRSSDLNRSEIINDVDIPLEMICTNSESETDDNEDFDSDGMTLGDKVRVCKSFQERDTVDVAVGDSIQTADKAVQAFDVVDRDYEKCIGHSVLTKVEYDPVDGSEILKPVIVPAEYNGKFEEQFIFYLQEREEKEVETDDDKGLPDPNETPLKDLIEANSPFVLEMLESIDSPLANGIIEREMQGEEVEASDESGKENEDQSKEPTNVVKELAKMVSDLSEDLKTTKNSETISKRHSEHGKKDRRKQILENMGSEEVDIAVQTLIEEDERSRSSSNDDDAVQQSVKKQKIINDGKNNKPHVGYSEDDCTIIE